MSTSYTYATLTADIYANLEDDSDELAAAIDQIIGRAEIRLLKDLKLEFMDSDEAITLTDGSQSVTKPSNILTDVELWYTSAGRKYPLEKRSLSWLRDYWPTAADEGLPLFYAEKSETAWEVAPTPNANFSGTARCIKRPAQLASTVTTTTWLSTNVGDALFYACMIEAEMFIKSDLDQSSRPKNWMELYTAALNSGVMELVNTVRATYNPVQPTPQQPQG